MNKKQIVPSRIKISIFGAAAILAVMAAGCDKPAPIAEHPSAPVSNYELFVGTTNPYLPLIYRLNKMTGDLALVDHDTLRSVCDMDSTNDLASRVQTYSQVWLFGTNQTKYQMMVEFKCKWENGNMRYIATATPYGGPIQEAMQQGNDFTVSLSFTDKDGFSTPMPTMQGALFKIPKGLLTAWFSTSDIVPKGNGQSDLKTSGEIVCTREDYLKLNAVNFLTAEYKIHYEPAIFPSTNPFSTFQFK
jgi:hypothetical protein